MFKKWLKPKTNVIECEMKHIQERMQKLDPASKEYEDCANALVKLSVALKTDRVDANTKALIFANLAGICLVLFHESAHVVASKAFGLVRKLI